MRISLVFKVEPAAGIEPATDGLQNRCSTAELSWQRSIAASEFHSAERKMQGKLIRESHADAAQIFNLLHRRIAFGRASPVAGAYHFAIACGLQIRDTAECNSALLRLRLRRAVAMRGSEPEEDSFETGPGRAAAVHSANLPARARQHVQSLRLKVTRIVKRCRQP